jgi:hypothetical protein
VCLTLTDDWLQHSFIERVARLGEGSLVVYLVNSGAGRKYSHPPRGRLLR